MSLIYTVLLYSLLSLFVSSCLCLAGGGGDPGGGNALELNIVGYGAGAAAVYETIRQELNATGNSENAVSVKNELKLLFDHLTTEIDRQAAETANTCGSNFHAKNRKRFQKPGLRNQSLPSASNFGLELQRALDRCHIRVIKERDFCPEGHRAFSGLSQRIPSWCKSAETRDGVGDNLNVLIKEERVKKYSEYLLQRLSLHEYVQNCLGYCDDRSQISSKLLRLVEAVTGLHSVIAAKDCKIGGCLFFTPEGQSASTRSYCQLINERESNAILTIPNRNPDNPNEPLETVASFLLPWKDCEGFFKSIEQKQGAPFILIQHKGAKPFFEVQHFPSELTKEEIR